MKRLADCLCPLESEFKFDGMLRGEDIAERSFRHTKLHKSIVSLNRSLGIPKLRIGASGFNLGEDGEQKVQTGN